MPFVKISGCPGKLYVPDEQKDWAKKHPCTDCFSCDHCSDDRCRVCRDKKEIQKNPPQRKNQG